MKIKLFLLNFSISLLSDLLEKVRLANSNWLKVSKVKLTIFSSHFSLVLLVIQKGNETSTSSTNSWQEPIFSCSVSISQNVSLPTTISKSSLLLTKQNQTHNLQIDHYVHGLLFVKRRTEAKQHWNYEYERRSRKMASKTTIATNCGNLASPTSKRLV